MNLISTGIHFKEQPEESNEFNLLRGTVLTVQTQDGIKRDLEILGSVVEMGTCYKLLSYDEG